MKVTWMKWGVCALAVIALAGCASTGGGKGPADEEVIAGLIREAMDALQAGDIDGMTANYSEDFASDQGGDLAATREFLNGIKDQGFLEDLSVSLDNLVITIDGDKATAEPIELEAAFGAVTIGLELEKQGGVWKVTYQTQN